LCLFTAAAQVLGSRGSVPQLCAEILDLTLFRRRNIGLIFQSFNLIPTLSAEENVLLPLMFAGSVGAEGQAKVDALLESLGMAHRRAHRPDAMSGGEQQMVAIARGLMAQPSLLLLDEPSLGLAPVVVEEVFERIRQVAQSGVTVLIVEQNVVDGLSLSGSGYVVENGRVVLTGSSKDLLTNQQIRTAYLGL